MLIEVPGREGGPETEPPIKPRPAEGTELDAVGGAVSALDRGGSCPDAPIGGPPRPLGGRVDAEPTSMLVGISDVPDVGKLRLTFRVGGPFRGGGGGVAAAVSVSAPPFLLTHFFS